MAYWGTGAPSVKLLDNEGNQIEVLVLPTPSERLMQGWFPEIEKPGTTLNLSDASIRHGYRFRARYKWNAVESTDMTKLLKVLNWDGQMRLWPHKDGTARMLVRMGQPSFSFPMGMVKYDAMNLEFEGIDLVPRAPDPATDIIIKIDRQGHIMTAENPEA